MVQNQNRARPEILNYINDDQNNQNYKSNIFPNLLLIMTDFTLGYWGLRGRGQVPRLLLAYTGAKWTNKSYTSPEQWFGGDKQSLGLSFPNLPYLIHGDFKITESSAIGRYIARATGHSQLLGKTSEEEATVDQLLGVIQDIFVALLQVSFHPNYQTERLAVYTKQAPKLELLSHFIGTKEWALGHLTLIDFVLSQFSHYIEHIWHEESKKYSSIHAIRERIENLEQVKAYYASEHAVKGPFLPKSAKWQ